MPAETWRPYGARFREHSTHAITPELLAALAQAESDGNPVARTYWRWRLTWHPFAIYEPASSVADRRRPQAQVPTGLLMNWTEERIAAAKKKCEAYGFVEGTNELAQCVMYVNEWRYAQPYPVFTTGIIGGVGHW